MPLENTGQPWHNPLLQRVQRHAALATLFRRSSAQPTSQTAPKRGEPSLILGQISVPAPMTVATAGASSPASQAEWGAAQESTPVAHPGTKVATATAPSAMQRAHHVSAVDGVAAMNTATAETLLPPAESPQATRSSVPTAPPITDNEQLWQRLRAIKQSHETQQAVITSAPAAATSDGARPSKPAAAKAITGAQREPLTSEPINTKGASGHPGPPPPVTALPQTHSPAVAQTSAVGAASEPGLQTKPALGQAPLANPGGDFAHGVDEAPPTAAPVPLPQEGEQRYAGHAGARQRSEPLGQGQQGSAIDADAHERSPVIPVTRSPALPAAELAVPPTLSEDSSAPAPLPLQAVWPVEHMASQRAASAPDTGVGVHDHVQRAGVDPHLQADIQQKLQAIRPGQPTEAAVDVIPPRRPRPVGRIPPASAGEEPNQGEPPGVTVQRLTIPAAAPAAEQGEQAAMMLVDTEIGPLPADLWQLIGQAPTPPPAQGEHVAEASAATGLSTDVAATRAREEHVTVAPDSMMAPPGGSLAAASTAVNAHTVQTAVHAAPRGGDTDADLPTVQRQPVVAAISPLTNQPSAAAMVAVSAAAGVSAMADLSAQSLRATAAQKAAAGEAIPDNATPTASQDGTATAVVVQTQRLEETPRPEEPPAVEAGAGTAKWEKKTLAVVDTDELARQVYLQLKQQLIIERERLRY